MCKDNTAVGVHNPVRGGLTLQRYRVIPLTVGYNVNLNKLQAVLIVL
jgi:hypothetical protein